MRTRPADRGLGVGVAHDHVGSGLGADLRDSRAHEPGSDDADPLDSLAQPSSSSLLCDQFRRRSVWIDDSRQRLGGPRYRSAVRYR